MRTHYETLSNRQNSQNGQGSSTRRGGGGRQCLAGRGVGRCRWRRREQPGPGPAL